MRRTVTATEANAELERQARRRAAGKAPPLTLRNRAAKVCHWIASNVRRAAFWFGDV